MKAVLPPPRRRRSRRLRKKLRIAEFQELGFGYEIEWAVEQVGDASDRFINGILEEVLVPRGLCLGGGPNVGFITARRGSATQDDQAAFDAWARQWPGTVVVRVGPLQDAWYDAG